MMTQYLSPQTLLFRVFICLSLLTLAPLSAANGLIPRAPDVDARGYLLMDAKSGQVIVEHNAEQELPPASVISRLCGSFRESSSVLRTTGGRTVAGTLRLRFDLQSKSAHNSDCSTQ